MNYFKAILSAIIMLTMTGLSSKGEVFTIGPSDGLYFYPTTFSQVPEGGDTIKILAGRTRAMKFFFLEGSASAPIVVINQGGQVSIDDTTAWGAMVFESCRFMKVSGQGDNSFHYGFRLRAATAGLSFGGLSSDCEVGFVEIHHSGFFGIVAKKDYGGTPPFPYPQFNNLIIHDTYIHHVDEAMYIGETKSPGMELRHVRIFNNIAAYCQREAIQLANCPEDVEVYNNYCFNTGRENLLNQRGSFQIGDNTVGRYYNNLFMKCPATGIIIMGSGDIEVFSNFIANTIGVFIDNRQFSNVPSAISLYGNYFYNNNPTGTELLSSLNEINEIHLLNNRYNSPRVFAKNKEGRVPLWDTTGNYFTQVDTVLYQISNGIFTLLPGNPAEYSNMGPKPGLSYVMNSTPEFATPADQYISFGDSLNLLIAATTSDNDVLTFEVRDLPAFITAESAGNGFLRLKGYSTAETKGVFHPVILVHDSSHNAYDRIKFKIAFKDTLNADPVLSLQNTYAMESASKLQVNITAADTDNDPITYNVAGLPEFATVKVVAGMAYINFNPVLADTGEYPMEVIADDGYGNPDTAAVVLTVSKPVLTEGRLLYRVNCGGPELTDTELNWQRDKEKTAEYGTDYSYATGSHSWKGTNTTEAPDSLFGPYRCCFTNMDSFGYDIPLPTNGLYELNLYFAERYVEVNNNTTFVFGVSVEDSTVLDSFNIYSEYGFHAAKKQYTVPVTDQRLNITVTKQQYDAKLNGMEIRFLEAYNNAPELSGLSDVTMNEATTRTLTLSISDDDFPGCNPISTVMQNAPAFISFTETNGNYSLALSPTYSDAGTYDSIHIVTSDVCNSREYIFRVTVIDQFENHPPVLGELQPVSMDEGTTAEYLFSASDSDNQTLTFSLSDLPSFAQFIQTSNGYGKLVLTPGYSGSGEYPVIISVTDTYQAVDRDTLIISVINSPVVERIILNASMITDLVRPPYGSWQSPAYLVDEQDKDPLLNQHPNSLSWKPYYNINYSPYHIYFDLGQEYVIKKVYVHDMNNVAPLVFSYGTPDSWNDWFTEPCNGYVHWKLHTTDVTTRYIRISEYNTISAYANEIAVYGYPVEEKSAEVAVEPESLVVYPNPASTNINISGFEDGWAVRMFDITGRLVISTDKDVLDVTRLQPGIYNLVIVAQNNKMIRTSRVVVE